MHAVYGSIAPTCVCSSCKIAPSNLLRSWRLWSYTPPNFSVCLRVHVHVCVHLCVHVRVCAAGVPAASDVKVTGAAQLLPSGSLLISLTHVSQGNEGKIGRVWVREERQVKKW